MNTFDPSVEYPIVFLNSVPKSGTHLMKQILEGIPGMSQNPHEFYEGYPEDSGLHYQRLQLVRSGHFTAGHVYYSPRWSGMLRELKIKPLFLNRDLRDVVISYTYFITDKYPNHPLRPYLLSLPDRNQQFLALIQGIPELQYPSIAAWYRQFAGWSGEADCLQIAFEHLVDSHSSRRRTMEQLIHYLWADKPLPLPLDTILNAMEQNINPKASYTFRTGTTGNWRTEFNEEVKTCFKEVAGHLLFPMGYETDYNW
ncbi:sulfotransferase domain-containing protein [Paenibacillus sp. FSL R7-0179]|uniref:sulfotransferase domain-containing protein n=1 Tax=Paenibacillus sp. FSL R7-0179 TaxID=2921672 RepID=UPI0030F82223